MSIQLLVQFTVKEDQVDTFVGIMQGAKSRIAGAAGCLGVEVMVSAAQPGKVVLSETWESQALHDEYAAKMRESGAMDKLAAFLIAPPESEVFEIK